MNTDNSLELSRLRDRIAALEAERGQFPRMKEVSDFMAMERDLAAARARIAALEAERDAHIKEINQLRLDRASIST
jgi:hypothetical protein